MFNIFLKTYQTYYSSTSFFLNACSIYREMGVDHCNKQDILQFPEICVLTNDNN